MLAAADALMAECRKQHGDYQISKAMDAIWRVVADANRYFAGQEPWALKKTDPARMETVLWTTAEVLRIVGILIQPYVPQSAAKLLDLLAVSKDKRAFMSIHERLVSGVALPAPTPVFPRFVEEETKPA
jgi:methionyl-tRNA synthetase